MNQQNIEPTLIEKPAPVPDTISAVLIEQALLIQSCHGTFHAARLLHSEGICISIALRALASTAQLRPRLAPSALLAPRRYGSVPALMYRHTWA
jgi:hypothetical protein